MIWWVEWSRLSNTSDLSVYRNITAIVHRLEAVAEHILNIIEAAGDILFPGGNPVNIQSIITVYYQQISIFVVS